MANNIKEQERAELHKELSMPKSKDSDEIVIKPLAERWSEEEDPFDIIDNDEDTEIMNTENKKS